MFCNLLQFDSLCWISVKAGGEKVPAVCRETTVIPPVRETQHYLRVSLEGNVSTKDVVQEDSQ